MHQKICVVFSNKVIREQLHEISKKVKTETSITSITHILDREFDSLSIFNFINTDINDDFVIRMKTTRVSGNSIMKGAENCEVITLNESELYRINDGGIIINNGICYTQNSNVNHSIVYCDGDISEFLEYGNYKKNKKLSKSLCQISAFIALNEANIRDWYLNHVKKRISIKLVAHQFPNSASKSYQKLMLKNKTYQDVKVIVDWGCSLSDDALINPNSVDTNKFQVVRVQIVDREDNNIFKQPMLLVTNKSVTNNEQAFDIYYTYLTRSKIEGVFKFLKDVLGWEDSQIQDFESMKTLLTFCYFIAAYFYEIESVLIKDPIIQYLAFLGNGKGVVSRTYVLRGLTQLLNKIAVDNWIKEYDITPEMLEEMYKLAFFGI